MLICYDDTYWQCARLAALHDVDIIVWVSASDRAMPGSLRKRPRATIPPSPTCNISRPTAALLSSQRLAVALKRIL